MTCLAVCNYPIDTHVAKSPLHGSFAVSGATALSIGPMRPKLALAANEFSYTCRLLTAPFIAPDPVPELGQETVGESENQVRWPFEGWARSCLYSEGEQECLRN